MEIAKPSGSVARRYKIRAAAHDRVGFVFPDLTQRHAMYVIAMNFGTSSETVNIEIEAASKRFEALHANCAKNRICRQLFLSLPLFPGRFAEPMKIVMSTQPLLPTAPNHAKHGGKALPFITFICQLQRQQ